MFIDCFTNEVRRLSSTGRIASSEVLKEQMPWHTSESRDTNKTYTHTQTKMEQGTNNSSGVIMPTIRCEEKKYIYIYIYIHKLILSTIIILIINNS
jgi:hypothetical protein